MITTRSASFTVYAIGQSIRQDKNGNKTSTGQKRLAITFQLDPKKGSTLLQASLPRTTVPDNYSARRVYAPTKLAYALVLCAALYAATFCERVTGAQKPPAGYLRIWHFAPSLKAPVSVSLVGGGLSHPLILTRAFTPLNVMSYRDVPPGQYKLQVRAANKELGVSDADPEMLAPVTVTVGDGTFQTVLLQDQGSSAKIFLSNDATVGTGIPPGAKRTYGSLILPWADCLPQDHPAK